MVTSGQRRRSASATDSSGEMCPAEPPPASSTDDGAVIATRAVAAGSLEALPQARDDDQRPAQQGRAGRPAPPGTPARGGRTTAGCRARTSLSAERFRRSTPAGAGTPMTGSMPITAPMLIRAWPMIQAMTPPVAIRTNGVVAAHDQPVAGPGQDARRARARPARRPGPSSSPMIAKMKSLWASGSQDHFSRLAPSPTPHQPPSARAYLPWMDWKQVLQLVRAGAAEPGVDPGHPVGRACAPGRGPAPVIPTAAPRKIRAGAPAAKSSAARTSEQDQAGAEVAPGQHQADDDDTDRQDDRDHDVRPRVSDARLRHSTVAAQTIRAILAASDGCSRWPANAIQLRLP